MTYNAFEHNCRVQCWPVVKKKNRFTTPSRSHQVQPSPECTNIIYVSNVKSFGRRVSDLSLIVVSVVLTYGRDIRLYLKFYSHLSKTQQTLRVETHTENTAITCRINIELNFSSQLKLKTVCTRDYCGSSVNSTCAFFVNIKTIGPTTTNKKINKFVENYNCCVEKSCTTLLSISEDKFQSH